MKKIIGITGNQNYNNKIKIKKFIFNHLVEHKDRIKIITPGQKTGADSIIKEVCLYDFNLLYNEVRPLYTDHDQYSVYPESLHNKPYNPRLLYSSLNKFVDISNIIVIFGEQTKSEEYILKRANKKNKQILQL